MLLEIGVVMMMSGGMAAGLNRMVCSNHRVVSSSRVALCQGHHRPVKKGHEAKKNGQSRTNNNVG